jgi:hypothetical protein
MQMRKRVLSSLAVLLLAIVVWAIAAQVHAANVARQFDKCCVDYDIPYP